MKIHINVSPYFDGTCTATSHCLLELGTCDLARIKDNNIHLSRKLISECGKVNNVLYNDVQYGNSVKLFKKRTVSNGKFICWNEINLPQMKYGYSILTINQ